MIFLDRLVILVCDGIFELLGFVSKVVQYGWIIQNNLIYSCFAFLQPHINPVRSETLKFFKCDDNRNKIWKQQ